MSLHDSDHEGIVRFFVALSCELGGFFILYYIILYYAEQFFPYQECNRLHYITRHNFSPTRSVTIKNYFTKYCNDYNYDYYLKGFPKIVIITITISFLITGTI